jgi:hypothetical protein
MKTLDKDVRGSQVVGAMFFLMSDWLWNMVEPCLLARDMDAPSWFMVAAWTKD